VTVAEAVAREHGVDVVTTTTRDAGTLVWQVRPAGAGADEGVTRHEFDLWRPGLGVRLVSAAVTITASHGSLVDLRLGDVRHGVDVTFDLGAASAAPPPAFDAG